MDEDSTINRLLHKPIAIVGMACRLPGGDGLDEFWQLLSEGGNAVTDIPPERLDRDLYYNPKRGIRGKSYSAIGGLIKDRPLDLDICPLDADDLRDSDPCHAVMCEVAAAACLNAGFDPRKLPHQNTGVYIGHSGGSSLTSELVFATLAAESVELLRDTHTFSAMPLQDREEVVAELIDQLRKDRPRRNEHGGPNIDANAIASLIAKSLGCSGPHMAIDAACASSLVALSIGAMAVQDEQVDMAIVGGASFNKADSLILFSQAQSCSATGSRPFDEHADGLVSSEGYCAVVLKSLDRALADGDRVDAVIRGIGMSTDGRGKSLWAPRKEGQAEALRRAYANDIDPAGVQYVEAHATSTQVGDATEMDALASFFGPVFGDRRIPVGSVKSNIGHTLETAGLASLIKTVLAMKHRVVPPTINCDQPSSAIPWNEIPFLVSSERTKWPQPSRGPRRAGVNAFGIGGLNVHVVLDEFAESAHRDDRLPQDVGQRRFASVNGRSKEAIALIGRGVILPGASSVQEFAELMTSGQSMISEAPHERWNHAVGVNEDCPDVWYSPTRNGGFIRNYEFDWKSHRIPPKQIARANPLQFMLIDAARQALAEAGYDRKEFDRARTAVLIGTVFGGEFGNQLLVGLRLPETLRELRKILAKRNRSNTDIARVMSEYEDLLLRFKPALLDETGSFTSSTLASRVTKELNLMGGAMSIDAGECSSLAGLDVASNLLRTHACSYVLCAGAQRAMDLVNYESLALRRQLVGSNGSSDGFFPGEGVAMLLLKRLKDAQRDGDRVLGVIHEVQGAFDPANKTRAIKSAAGRVHATAHRLDSKSICVESGCGIARLDEMELTAVQEVYGAIDVHRAGPPLTNQIGNTLAASGAASLVRLTIPLDKQGDPNSEGPTERAFAVSSVASSGLAYHAIGERCVANPAREQTRLVVDSARDADVCDRDASRTSTRKQLPRVAFIFPGQGSQYSGMLRTLVQNSPAARAAIAEADDVMREMASDSFAELAWGHREKMGRDIWSTQIAMLVADVAMYRAIVERGFCPDVISSHSYGEFPAMVAAGVLTLEQAIRLTRARTDAIENAFPPRDDQSPSNEKRELSYGAMLSIAASPQEIESLLSRLQCEVYLTHFNAPKQTVVGGDAANIDRLTEFLAAEKVPAQRLRVPCAYHTPLMQGAQQRLRRSLEHESFRPPQIPLLSSATNRYVAEPDEVKENLIAQLTSPVRYVQLIERLATDGTEIFVEVGPQNVLTKLNHRILADFDVRCIASNISGRDDIAQLDEVTALFQSAGWSSNRRDITTDENPQQVPITEIINFDATAVRRNRLRRQAEARDVIIRAPASTIHDLESFDATTVRDRSNNRNGGQSKRSHSSHSNGDASQSNQLAAPPDQLEQFLIEFMVEQTGYPAEMIELDWDFEADLGIDSIKKAQMFGELGEMFDLSKVSRGANHDGVVSLDEFRSLRQVMELIRRVDTGDKKCRIGNARKRPEADEPEPVEPPSSRAVPPDGKHDGMEEFLINFVVDQTGYPPDIVDLDAEFEADLGIDSIKLAQMVGELSEQFSVEFEKTDRAALGEFRTLRHVLDALRLSNGNARTSSADSVEKTADRSSNGRTKYDSRLAAIERVDDAKGERYRYGFERGREHALAIRSMLRQSADRALETKIELSSNPAEPSDHFSSSELDELRGIADGARIHVGNVIAYNHYCRNGDSSPILLTKGRDVPAGIPNQDVEAVTSRYVLRMSPAPQRSGAPAEPIIAGAAAIIGENRVSDELKSRLTNLGVETHTIATSEDATDAVSKLEQIWNVSPITHLFLLTPQDDDAATSLDSIHWHSRRNGGIMTPYWVCQRWLKLVDDAHLMDDAALVGVTSLGGRFGFDGHVHSAESGGLTGLLKAIKIESWVNGHRTLPVKLIDNSPNATASEIVDSVFRELAAPSYDMEISWANGQRHVVHAIEQPIDSSQREPISTGGTWVCTGGARGITSFVARELGRRFGLKLHLLGTAPLPNLAEFPGELSAHEMRDLKLNVMSSARESGQSPIAAWEKTEKELEICESLAKLDAMGITATYHSCDVSDREALERVLDEVRRTSGPIEGILHGAGIGKDARFENKDASKVDQCIKAKVDGTLALMDRTRNDPLKYFVAFGSISGRFGANGHTDYSLANDMMAKLVNWYRRQRPKVAAMTFHWHAWDDVGMATKPETKLALEMIGMQFMPAREGLEHLIRELEAGAPEGEVLITDDKYHRLFYPSESFSQSNGSSTSDDDLTPKYPLLDRGQVRTENGQQTTSIELNPMVEPFLLEHRLGGRPLLPLVIGIELLNESAARFAGTDDRLCLRNVEAISGLRFFSDSPKTVHVETRQLDESSVGCSVFADFNSRDGKLVEPNRVYLKGVASNACEELRPLRDLSGVRQGQWNAVEYPDESSHFHLGPSLRCLRKIKIEDGAAWGQVIAPSLIELVDAKRSVAGWIVPSAALDACFYATGLLAWCQVKSGTALPSKIGRLQLGRRVNPGEACLVETHITNVQDRIASFDFSLFGDDGATILEVEDYQIVWLGK